MLALTLTLLVLFMQLSLACGCEVAASLIEIPTLPPRIHCPSAILGVTAWVCHWLDQPMLVQLSLTCARC